MDKTTKQITRRLKKEAGTIGKLTRKLIRRYGLLPVSRAIRVSPQVIRRVENETAPDITYLRIGLKIGAMADPEIKRPGRRRKFKMYFAFFGPRVKIGLASVGIERRVKSAARHVLSDGHSPDVHILTNADFHSEKFLKVKFHDLYIGNEWYYSHEEIHAFISDVKENHDSDVKAFIAANT